MSPRVVYYTGLVGWLTAPLKGMWQYNIRAKFRNVTTNGTQLHSFTGPPLFCSIFSNISKGPIRTERLHEVWFYGVFEKDGDCTGHSQIISCHRLTTPTVTYKHYQRGILAQTLQFQYPARHEIFE